MANFFQPVQNLIRKAAVSVEQKFVKLSKDFVEARLEAACQRVEASHARTIAKQAKEAARIRLNFQDTLAGKFLNKAAGKGTAEGLVQKWTGFKEKAKDLGMKAYATSVIVAFAMPLVALFGAVLPNPASHDLWNFMLGTGKYRKRNNAPENNKAAEIPVSNLPLERTVQDDVPIFKPFDGYFLPKTFGAQLFLDEDAAEPASSTSRRFLPSLNSR